MSFVSLVASCSCRLPNCLVTSRVKSLACLDKLRETRLNKFLWFLLSTFKLYLLVFIFSSTFSQSIVIFFCSLSVQIWILIFNVILFIQKVNSWSSTFEMTVQRQTKVKDTTWLCNWSCLIMMTKFSVSTWFAQDLHRRLSINTPNYLKMFPGSVNSSRLK